MSGQIVVRLEAVADMRQLMHAIWELSPSVARKVLTDVERAWELLATFPELGSPWLTGHRDYIGLQTWVVRRYKKYVIFYRPVPDRIEVIRVVYGPRDLEKMIDEEF